MNIKRIATFFMTVILISQMGTTGAVAKASKHWADDYVNYLSKQEELKDYISSSILKNLNKPITREDFLSLLLGSLQMQSRSDSVDQITFEDWKKLPNNSITREEAVTIAGKFCRLESNKEIGFTDAESISTYAHLYISAFKEQGIIVGSKDNVFNPKSELTSAEAIVIIAKLIEKGFISNNLVLDYAGNENGYKDGDALQSGFNRPIGLCSDGKGGIIVADSYNNLIRRIANNKVETIAGNQTIRLDSYRVPIGGYVNGGVKITLFNKPQFCAVNPKGEILVSDTENNSIRIIANSVTTSLNSSTTAGYKDGKLSEALFNKPSDIVYDKQGNIFVADTLNNCIRYIDVQKGEVSTFAGKQSSPGLLDGSIKEALFNEPIGLALDKNGVLYISDSGNQRIRKIDNGVVSTLAGSGNNILEETKYIEGGYADGTKEQAKFMFPSGIDVNNDGVVFVADTGNHRIRAISANKVTTVAGNGEASYLSGMLKASSFNEPSEVLYSEGKLYISDSFNSKIRVIDIGMSFK